MIFVQKPHCLQIWPSAVWAFFRERRSNRVNLSHRKKTTSASLRSNLQQLSSQAALVSDHSDVHVAYSYLTTRSRDSCRHLTDARSNVGGPTCTCIRFCVVQNSEAQKSRWSGIFSIFLLESVVRGISALWREIKLSQSKTQQYASVG